MQQSVIAPVRNTGSASSSSMSLVKLRAKKANKQVAKLEVPVPSTKELVEAASKIQVSKKEPVKTPNGANPESSAPSAEEAVKRFSICYMEAQNQGDNVSCIETDG